MSKRVHQRLMEADLNARLEIDASVKSAGVLYHGEIRRVSTGTRLTWEDAEIEDGVSYVLTKADSYYAEVVVTFVDQNAEDTTVTANIAGNGLVRANCKQADGRVHIVSIGIDVYE